MKPCGCDFCNDLRNIEPAKYIGGGDEELKEFIRTASGNKEFVYHYRVYEGTMFVVVDKCPVCGYEFTEEDYDSYD